MATQLDWVQFDCGIKVCDINGWQRIGRPTHQCVGRHGLSSPGRQHSDVCLVPEQAGYSQRILRKGTRSLNVIHSMKLPSFLPVWDDCIWGAGEEEWWGRGSDWYDRWGCGPHTTPPYCSCGYSLGLAPQTVCLTLEPQGRGN